MKKLLVTLLAVGGLAVYANAQGTMTVDSGANFGDGATVASTTGGLVFINGVRDNATDINLTLLWGTTAGTVNNVLNLDPLLLNSPANTSWLASQPTGSGDMTSYGGGAMFDPNGNTYVVPTAAAGSQIFIMLEGWTGNATSYAAALTTLGANAGQLANPFSITLAANTSPIQPDTHGMGSLNLVSVPEPATIALGSLGGAALLAFRRRKA